MPDETCSHQWKMVNVINGFIVTEKCFQCEMISTYFAYDQRPPLEEYRDGDHFWNFMESAQSIQFDLQCTKCGVIVKFNELLGFMLCTGCDDSCGVDLLRKRMEPERTWVYVAFGFLPVDKKKQLTPDKISILEDYINQRRKSTTSRIVIVSQDMVRDIRNCYGEVIKDVEMLSLTQPDQ